MLHLKGSIGRSPLIGRSTPPIHQLSLHIPCCHGRRVSQIAGAVTQRWIAEPDPKGQNFGSKPGGTDHSLCSNVSNMGVYQSCISTGMWLDAKSNRLDAFSNMKEWKKLFVGFIVADWQQISFIDRVVLS
eukprot:3607880-Ditylum_brightwellii.AAC.1